MKNCTKFWVVITILFFISCEKPFKAHFEEITGEKFLEQMEIMCQESTDSDVFGDYGAILIVKVGEVFYKKLPAKLLKKNFNIAKEISLPEFEDKMKIYKQNIVYQYEYWGSTIYYSVGFLADKESIILIRSSW